MNDFSKVFWSPSISSVTGRLRSHTGDISADEKKDLKSFLHRRRLELENHFNSLRPEI
jgi:hypothetical protein